MKKNLQRGYRNLRVNPSTIDVEKRTVEVSLGTGERGKRYNWYGEDWYEELEVSENAIRMKRLKDGAPFLDAHRSYSNDSVLGVFEDAWISDGEVQGRVRFDETELAEKRFGSIQRGILKNTSVGYDIHELKELEERAEDGLRIFRATDWEPMEGSVVPIGFDSTAKIRSESSPEAPCRVIEIGEQKIENPISTRSDQGMGNETENKTVDEKVLEETRQKAADEAKKAERLRVKNITEACRKMGCEDKAQGFIDSDDSYETIAKRLVEEKSVEEPVIDSNVNIEVGESADEKRTRAMTNALLYRVNKKRYKKLREGNIYTGASIVEMARFLLGDEFRFARKTKVIRSGLHHTTDFPIILANVANKTLRDEYNYQGSTWEPFCRETQLPDFKPMARDRLGDSEKLEIVNEHGEYKHTTMDESKEEISVKKYGKIFGITFEALVNDDLSAFERTPLKIAQAASRVKSDLVYDDILIANPNMSDGNALFSTAHNNLTSPGSALSETSLNDAFVKFYTQTGETGDYINIPPAYLIVAPQNKATAQRLVKEITATKSTDVNPFSGELEPITEARLSTLNNGLSWFLSARPEDIDTIEVADLEEDGGLVLDEFEDKKKDGLFWKARQVSGAKAIDWKGLYKNVGA